MTWAPLVYACDIEGREMGAYECEGYLVTESSSSYQNESDYT